MRHEIEAKLSAYQDPFLEKDLISTRAVKDIIVEADRVILDICLGYPVALRQEELKQALLPLLQPVIGDKFLEIRVSSHIESHVGKSSVQSLPNVKNIIAVGSGKGGVGKSLVSVNLALALAQVGAQVGLLDADIYGPSQPTMLGVKNEKPVIEDKLFLPIKRHGIQSMSIGYLIGEDTPMVWRGPMIGKALQQLLQDTRWDALDYLIIDLPPGTGDIHLTMCQKIPVSGAVIVTTPQDMALLDVRRACEMFNKLDVPILGVVENMSHYHCDNCGHDAAIFGKGGAEKLAQEYSLSLLGSIPLAISLREMTDRGESPVIAKVENEFAIMFRQLARKVAAKLSLQTKNYSAKFPKIVVRNV